MNYNITWRKKDKGWQFIISYKDITGRWKQKSKQGFKTQKDGKPLLDKMLKEIESNVSNAKLINMDSIDLSFKEVSDMYLKHSIIYKEYYTVKASQNTLSKFKKLNNKKIKDIKKFDIQNVFDQLIKKGLKQSSIESHLTRLKTFFKYVRDDLNLIIELPTKNIKIPKEKELSTKKALTKHELTKLLDDLSQSKYYMVAYIAANTGMRLGEVLGLTWDDINIKDSTISVNKQWKVLKNKKSGFGKLKSSNSYRIIPVSHVVIKEFKNYKKSNPIDINNRVTPFNQATIDKYLNEKMKNLAGITMHELRHTYATLLIANGVDFKTAAKLLGHTVEMTMKTYSHVTDDMMKKATGIIENIF